jgi:hypothetical protein
MHNFEDNCASPIYVSVSVSVIEIVFGLDQSNTGMSYRTYAYVHMLVSIGTPACLIVN